MTVIIISVLSGLVIWQRRRVLSFFRAIVSARYNNWIFLGLLAMTTFLFFNAIYQGGGEPMGLGALKEIGKPAEESPIVKYYSDSIKHFVGPIDKEPGPNHLTWFWWKLFLGSLISTIIFIPLAFWDEVVAGINRGKEIAEQRRGIISLRPAPSPGQQQPQTETGQTQPRQPHASFWTRFRERFLASASADMAIESIFAIGGRLFRRLITF